jgi:hypothetical protein
LSTLKFGPEIDFEIQERGNPFWQYIGLAPFYQTDFYGIAQAEGGTVSWTPSYHPLFILGSPLEGPQLIDGFVEPRFEATYLNVEKQGQTNLHVGSYDWLGGAARAYIFFFSSNGRPTPYWSEYIVDKFALAATFQYYEDLNSSIIARMYSVALQYKLVCDNSGQMTLQDGEKVPCGGGSPSLTLQYDSGRDRDNLQEVKKLALKLNYAF